ncbi:hypothetical protein FRC01_000035 [Tulasnella sp. 417]|nr:hypothetical protein FRC01_000035 [Tulasnella sp. 417]
MNGAYITDPGKVGGETSQADDMQLAENVWSLCENLIKEKLGSDALYSWGDKAQYYAFYDLYHKSRKL